jgi:hypothetical protein
VAAVLRLFVCVKCLLLLWVGEWCVPVTRKDATKWHCKQVQRARNQNFEIFVLDAVRHAQYYTPKSYQALCTG